MAEAVKVLTTRGVVLAVGRPVVHLIVIPLVGNTLSGSLVLETVHIAGGSPRSKILAVATIALVPVVESAFVFWFQGWLENSHVMGKDAGVSGVLGILGQGSVPLQGRSGVVGAVEVVVVDDGGLVVVQRDIIADRGSGGLGLLHNSGLRLRLRSSGGSGLLRLGGSGSSGLLRNDGSGNDDVRGLGSSGVNSLVSGGSGILEEDDIGGLLASRDGHGNDIVDPFGLQSTLRVRTSHRASRRQHGADANEEEGRLHHVRY